MIDVITEHATICANHLALEADGRTVHVTPTEYANLSTPYNPSQSSH